MEPIILTVVIAGGVIFLFVLAGRLARFIRQMEEEPRAAASVRRDNTTEEALPAAGQKDRLTTPKAGSGANPSD